MLCDIAFDIIVDFGHGERCDHSLLELRGPFPVVAATGLEEDPIVGSKVLAPAADHHFDVPFSRLVQSIVVIEVDLLLAFVVAIADQDDFGGST